MEDLPRGWTEASIEELAGSDGLMTDGDWIESKDQNPNGEVRLIQLADVGDGVFQNRSSRFLTAETAERLRCTYLQKGDLLIARMPDPLGRACLFPGLKQPCVTAVDVCIWRAGTGAADPQWLMHVINSPEVRDRIQAQASGTTRQRISGGNLKRLTLPLPPLAEQRRIVARIEALFARTRRARAELGRVAALAPRYRAQVLATTFDADPERGQGATIADLAATVFDGPFGSSLKSEDYSATGVRVVRLENIGHLRFIAEKQTFIPEAKAEALARHTLHPGDVLFSSFVDREVRVCVLPSDLPTSAINKADCFCVRVGDACLPEFLAYRLSTPATYEHMRETVHGATRPRINLAQLKQYRIDLPTVDEQRATVRAIGSARASADKAEAEATRALTLLDRLDAAILARAFRGELVPQDPADEPARLPHPPAAIARPRRRAAPPA